MANGDGDLHSDGFWRDMPWWVKAIALVGVPSLISIGVVVSDRTQLAETVHLNGERLQRIELSASVHDQRVLVRFDDLSQQTAETNRILVATCVNAAVTIEARERCVGRR